MDMKRNIEMDMNLHHANDPPSTGDSDNQSPPFLSSLPLFKQRKKRVKYGHGYEYRRGYKYGHEHWLST